MLNCFTNPSPLQMQQIRAISPIASRSSSKPPVQPHAVGSTYPNGRNTYQIIQDKDLGKGTFGSVKLVKELKSGKPYAMKIISREKVKKLNADENIYRELVLQSRLNHRNVLKLHEYFEDKNDILMILEYCAKGNLYQLLQQKKKLSESEAFSIFYQICQGVEFLHVQGICHRDLKPENILFFENKTVKICDYNWAKKLAPGKKCDPVICGTTEYMPPEVVSKQQHDNKVDIWSLGIMLYEFFHGDIPFKGQNQKDKIQNILCTSLKINQELPLDLQILIHQLLSRSADQRPSIQQIYKSRWVQRMIKDFEQKPSQSPARPMTTYLKVRGESERLSYFSSMSQNTTNATSGSKDRHHSTDKRHLMTKGNSLASTMKPTTLHTPDQTPKKEEFNILNHWDSRIKNSINQNTKVIPVKALGASNTTVVFGNSDEKTVPLKRATSYSRQPNFNHFGPSIIQRVEELL